MATSGVPVVRPKRRLLPRKIDQGVAAVVVSVITSFGLVGTTVATVVNASDPAPSKPCIEIYRDYFIEINEATPPQREAIRKFMTVDPQANYCHLKPDLFPQ
jgi:hypothetical protein